MKISIITVVLNNKAHIENCICSVLNQGCANVEYIVIDGGSQDGTVDSIRKYDRYLSAWISEPDRGIYDAMNKGISMATGDIIGLLNADDYYASNTVLADVASVFRDMEVDSCYGDLTYVADRDRITRYWKAGPYRADKFYWGWMPPHPTFFVLKQCYEKFGAFNLNMGSSADYELLLRFLLKHKIKTYYIPKVLVKMRTGGVSNASLKNRIAANRKDLLAWRVNGLTPYRWTILLKPISKIGQFIQ